jgi:hypothetical protein
VKAVEGLTRNGAHQYFLDGRGPIVSVTTVTNILDKGFGLDKWKKTQTALAALDHLEVLAAMVTTAGREATADWLTAVPTQKTAVAADMGSRVHALADAIAKGQEPELSPDEEPFVAAYRSFLTEYEPTFHATEEMVYSAHGYAGTFDAIASIEGQVWMLDYKTSKGVYAETGMQLAAYARADFIGKPGDPKRYRIPPIERHGVVHIRPDGAELYPFAVTDETYAAFLACLRLHGWRNGEAKTVKQSPRKEVAA